MNYETKAIMAKITHTMQSASCTVYRLKIV